MSSFFWSFPWKKILWSFFFQREALFLTGKFFGQCKDFSFLEAPKISFQNKKFQGRCFFLLYGHHHVFSKRFLGSLKSFTPKELPFPQEYFLFLQNPSWEEDSFFFKALCGTFYPERSLISIHQGKGGGSLSQSSSSQTSKKIQKKKFSFFVKKIILEKKKISFEGMTFFSLGVKD